MDWITNHIHEIILQQKEYTERMLSELISQYDFIVGSQECKYKLMDILPEGANIVYSPYIGDPTTVYVVKKFDIVDLLKDSPFLNLNEAEKEVNRNNYVI